MCPWVRTGCWTSARQKGVAFRSLRRAAWELVRNTSWLYRFGDPGSSLHSSSCQEGVHQQRPQAQQRGPAGQGVGSGGLRTPTPHKQQSTGRHPECRRGQPCSPGRTKPWGLGLRSLECGGHRAAGLGPPE